VIAAVLIVAAIAVGVLRAGESDSSAGSPTLSGESANPPVAESGTPAPELRGVDPITGRRVSLRDFAGKPVVVNVWASWCPGCNDEAADLRDFAADHPEAVVLGIDFQDTLAGARSFYRRWEWQHPSIFDSSGTQSAALGLFGMPTTFFLDAGHRVMALVVGATDRYGFEEGLALATRSS